MPATRQAIEYGFDYTDWMRPRRLLITRSDGGVPWCIRFDTPQELGDELKSCVSYHAMPQRVAQSATEYVEPSPASLVVVSRVSPVCALVTTTFTFDIRAPLESLTDPVICPVAVCAPA